MALFDALISASFNGIKFPVKTSSVRGGLRHHIHEFPHTPGGQPEKLGRKLYEFHMTALFHGNFRKYPQLWPNGIRDLFALFESGETYHLGVPTLGVIFAFCVDWSKEQTARVLSGEEAEFTFLEDDSDAFLRPSNVLPTPDAVAAAYDKFTHLAADVDPKDGLLDSLQKAVNSFTAIKDQIELQGNLVAARLDKIASMCDQIDSSARFLNSTVNNAGNAFDNPALHNAKEALHDLWFSALSLSRDVTRTNGGSKPARYIVPVAMTATTAAKAALGDASRAVELMQINQVDDPFGIPPGTVLLLPPG